MQPITNNKTGNDTFSAEHVVKKRKPTKILYFQVIINNTVIW